MNTLLERVDFKDEWEFFIMFFEAHLKSYGGQYTMMRKMWFLKTIYYFKMKKLNVGKINNN